MALRKQGALYTLISRLKFSEKMQYEIETLNSNLKSEKKEVEKIRKSISLK
jgi:hypothetical protein